MMTHRETRKEFKGLGKVCKVHLAVIGAIGIGLYSCNSHAGGFLEVGIDSQTKQPCYLWNQRCVGFPTKEELTNTFVRAGYVFDTGIGVSAFNLGRTHTDAIAANDEVCVLQHPSNASSCGPTQRYVTDGSAMGIALTFQHQLGDVRVEVGPTFVERTFRVQTDGGTGLGLTDRIDLLELQSNKAHGVGYMLGLGLNLTKKVSLFASFYNDNVGGRWPSGFSKTFTGGLRIGF